MSELKKCPFCGGSDITYFFNITCGFVCEDCGVTFGGFKTYEEAIKAWNTRKPMDKIVERLEQIKMRYFLTIANTGDENSDSIYEEVGNAIDKAIEIIKQEGGLT